MCLVTGCLINRKKQLLQQELQMLVIPSHPEVCLHFLLSVLTHFWTNYALISCRSTIISWISKERGALHGNVGSLMWSAGIANSRRKSWSARPFAVTVRALCVLITANLSPPVASPNWYTDMQTAFQWDRAYSVAFKREIIADFTLFFHRRKSCGMQEQFKSQIVKVLM